MRVWLCHVYVITDKSSCQRLFTEFIQTQIRNHLLLSKIQFNFFLLKTNFVYLHRLVSNGERSNRLHKFDFSFTQYSHLYCRYLILIQDYNVQSKLQVRQYFPVYVVVGDKCEYISVVYLRGCVSSGRNAFQILSALFCPLFRFKIRTL